MPKSQGNPGLFATLKFQTANRPVLPSKYEGIVASDYMATDNLQECISTHKCNFNKKLICTNMHTVLLYISAKHNNLSEMFI